MTYAEQTTLQFDNQAPRKKKRRKRPTSPCLSEGCPQWAWAQGYCGTHYQKLKSLGVLKTQRIMKDDLARFHTKYTVDEATGCWLWTGAIHPSGYATMGITVDGKLKCVRASRFAYEKLVGPLADGMQALHRCDRPACVCPEHLFAGTPSDNMRDCVAKGRHGTQRGKSGPKVTKAMALNIRVMYARGLVGSYGNKAKHYSLRELADIFGLQLATVRAIVKGTAHLTP